MIAPLPIREGNGFICVGCSQEEVVEDRYTLDEYANSILFMYNMECFVMLLPGYI